jgi:hypothetical protein
VHAGTLGVEGEERWLVQQTFQVDIGTFADHFDLESIRRVDGFLAVEGQHFEVVRDAIDSQTESCWLLWAEHSLSLSKVVVGKVMASTIYAVNVIVFCVRAVADQLQQRLKRHAVGVDIEA